VKIEFQNPRHPRKNRLELVQLHIFQASFMHLTPKSTFRTAFAPALPWPQPTEVVVAMAGGAAGIGACSLLVWMMQLYGSLPLFLMAPLGASAVLVFAVPNSPLAQPWSAVMGNTLSALCGVTALALLPGEMAPVAAVALAFAAMMLGRALHPPGGAVALLIGLSPELLSETGALMILANTAVMTGTLVASGLMFHRFSGRKYPFRTSLSQSGPPPLRRQGLTEENLSYFLSKFHQSTNLGAVDLARLVAAVEAELIAPPFEGLSCADVADKKHVHVSPEASLQDILHKLQQSETSNVAVVGADGRLQGIIPLRDVLRNLTQTAPERSQAAAPLARDLMLAPVTSFHGTLPLGDALHLMVRDNLDHVPVCREEVFEGFLTRSLMLEALVWPDTNRKAA
jgi:CBS domain-containing membrane protein